MEREVYVGLKVMLTGLVVLGSALACGFGTTEPDVQEDIVGVWAWISSTGGIAGTTRTPTTEGFTQTLRITAVWVLVHQTTRHARLVCPCAEGCLTHSSCVCPPIHLRGRCRSKSVCHPSS